MLLLDDLEACLPQRATLFTEKFGTTVWGPGKASALVDVLEMLDLTFTSPCSLISDLYKFSHVLQKETISEQIGKPDRVG